MRVVALTHDKPGKDALPPTVIPLFGDAEGKWYFLAIYFKVGASGARQAGTARSKPLSDRHPPAGLNH